MPFAAFLLVASSASAVTFYVDIDGGSDTAYDGSSPTVTGVGMAGPFMTINRALTAAGNGDTVVILASTYPESFTVAEDNLTIRARREGGDLTVRLTGSVSIGTSGNNAPGAMAPIDVYVGQERVADNLRFGEATAYLTVGGVDGTVTLAVAIAPENSTSPTGALRMAAHEVTQGGSYAIVVLNDGADASPGDAYDSQILSVTTTQASSSTAVEMFAVNAAPDVPSLDIGVENAARFFTGLSYGETSAVPMTGVDGALLRYLVYDTGAAVRFYTGSIDLSSAEGERGLLIAQGLRTPIPTQPSRAFQLASVRPTGAVIPAVNTTPGEEGLAVPTEFALHGTAPNPFRTHTSVRFDLPQAAEVTVEVYDALGRRVAQSVQSAMAPGTNLAVAVDGTGLAAGLYVYRLVARGETQSWSRTGQIVVAR